MTGKAKAAKAAAEARQDATLALSQALPQLLRKFSTDDMRVRTAAVACPLTGLGIRMAIPVSFGAFICLPLNVQQVT